MGHSKVGGTLGSLGTVQKEQPKQQLEKQKK